MKHVLIVGRPGIGKTLLMKRLAQELRGRPIDGFLTEELREQGERLGFWLSSLDGRQVLLAHKQMDSSHRVGDYKVNVAVLDDVGVSILQRARRQALVLFLDEIGAMELCSQAFQQAVAEALDHGPHIVATGGLHGPPFLDAVKRRKDVEIIPLSEANGSAVYEELLARLQALCDEDEQVRQLQRQADRICELIVSGETPGIDIEIQQEQLRDMVGRMFPDKQALYGLLFESRFRRLRQQFRGESA